MRSGVCIGKVKLSDERKRSLPVFGDMGRLFHKNLEIEMTKGKKEYRVKTKDSLFDKLLSKAVRLFKKETQIINLSGEELPDRFIMLGNHSAASGPMSYRMFLPKRIMTWAAYPMCEGYVSRWKYLYDVFYGQKLHMKNPGRFFAATGFGIVSRIIYMAGGVIPVYNDMRMKTTIEHSMECLNKNVGVLVFPEDSSEGYHEKLTRIFGGFQVLAREYKRKNGEDIPIYTVYYSKKLNKMVIGKPYFYSELKKTMTDADMLEYLRDDINGLFEKYLEKELISQELEDMRN